MADRTLRAVGDGEKAPPVPPASLAEATETDRRSLLVRARLEIARTIDAGVPPHALARLISEMERLDSEIRRMDSLRDAEEAPASGPVDNDAFDATAI
jgi:hypothetical protein